VYYIDVIVPFFVDDFLIRELYWHKSQSTRRPQFI